MRVLAVADSWDGSDAYAYVRAFRRLGHSVHHIDPGTTVPSGWSSLPLRALRRGLEPLLVRELGNRVLDAADAVEPDLLFVFKGRYVSRRVIEAVRAKGVTAVNFYPDVSFLAHGRHLPKTLPAYDWIFNSKSYGVEDLRRVLDVERASFLPHGFDPGVHRPPELTEHDMAELGADVSFIGTWSPKKQRYLEALVAARPNLRVRIWGSLWDGHTDALRDAVQHRAVYGDQYARAIAASRINLCILSEARKGSSTGDQTTARTFQIPAIGGFLLHERTAELARFLEEGKECACFEDPRELVAMVDRYLADDQVRRRIADAGLERARTGDLSVDGRAAEVVAWVEERRC